MTAQTKQLLTLLAALLLPDLLGRQLHWQCRETKQFLWWETVQQVQLPTLLVPLLLQ